MTTFQEVWAELFAPRMAEKMRRETEFRTDAFFDTTLTVCDEEIRQMTPADLLMLDAFDCPFVSGHAGIALNPVHRQAFLWQLHSENREPGVASFRASWQEARLERRLAPRKVVPDFTAIAAYCDRMLFDLTRVALSPLIEGDAALQKTPPTYFLSPLLVAVASEIGPHDPMSGRLLSDTPLPRLLQYAKDIRRQNEGDKHADYGELARLQSDCLAETNKRNREAESAGAAD